MHGSRGATAGRERKGKCDRQEDGVRKGESDFKHGSTCGNGQGRRSGSSKALYDDTNGMRVGGGRGTSTGATDIGTRQQSLGRC